MESSERYVLGESYCEWTRLLGACIRIVVGLRFRSPVLPFGRRLLTMVAPPRLSRAAAASVPASHPAAGLALQHA